MLVIRTVTTIAGIVIILVTLRSAVRGFVLPRSAPDTILRTVFVVMRRIFNLLQRRRKTFAEKDAIMAIYGPLTVVVLLPVWMVLTLLGFMLLYWGLGIPTWEDAFVMSGSSLLTLGFAKVDSLLIDMLNAFQSALGLLLVALLIAYLPTMHSAFSEREVLVKRLDTYAGAPPSSVQLLLRTHRIGMKDNLDPLWQDWENWFARLGESHASLPALVFYRSPSADQSWVNSAGAILDAAALYVSVVDSKPSPQAQLMIRAGYLALRSIADFFNLPYRQDPTFPAVPIQVTRAEFLDAVDILRADGIPLKEDLDQAWQDFGGWRVNYEDALLALCGLTMAPEALWSGDRAPTYSPPLRRSRAQHSLTKAD